MRLFTPMMLTSLLLGALPAAANEPIQQSDTATAKSAQPLASGSSTFELLDVDRDGWLARQEAEASTDEELDFDAADENGDGLLSSDEWSRRAVDGIEEE
jgi:hypothetical protein